jgi:hypothetical protein
LVDKPKIRVRIEKLSALQNLIWHELQDESMRLASYPVPAGSYFMMGRLTVNQSTLKKALKLAAKFYAMVTQAFKMTLTADDEIAFLHFELDSPQLDPHYMFAKLLLLAFHRYASWLIADSFPLKKTHFHYSPPAHISEYSYLFVGIHIFDSNMLGFAFPASYLQLPV